MQLVHLPPDPRHLVRKVDLVAEILPRLGRRAQREHGRGYHGAAGFLVVEDRERGRDQDHEE